jgi:hypothetical protein
MSINAELALTAARVRLLARELPPHLRPDVPAEWAELLASLERRRTDASKTEALRAGRRAFEERVSGRLANAPLV